MNQSYNEHPKSVNQQNSTNSTPITPKAKAGFDHQRETSGGKTRLTSPRSVVNNLDYLKVSLWIEWNSSELFDQLQALKDLLQQFENPSFPFVFSKSISWNLSRTGTSHYSFRLSSGDLTLLLNRRKSTDNVPNTRIEIGSISCWSPGFLNTFEKVIEWLKSLGGTIKQTKVSEAHLAVDFIDTCISKLGIDDESRWITNAHQFNIHKKRRKLSGITVGKDKLLLRIYDKVLELKDSPHKQVIFSKIWNTPTYNQHPVTRVEFQLRRETLKEFGSDIDTVEGLINSLQSIWNYCTKKWARFSDRTVNRNHNQTKSKNDKFWNQVSSTPWTGTSTLTRNKINQNKNFDVLLNTFTGCAMTLAAFDNAHPEDLDHIIGYSQHLIKTTLTRLYQDDQLTFIKKMQKKTNEIYVSL